MPRPRKPGTRAERQRAKRHSEGVTKPEHGETVSPDETGFVTGSKVSSQGNVTGKQSSQSNGATPQPLLGPWGPLSPQQMQAERLARGEPLVRDLGDPSGIEAWRVWVRTQEADHVHLVMWEVPKGRAALRARLKALEDSYGRAASIQDWERCTEINAEREPLFAALHELEKGLPRAERYWMPSRLVEAV